MDFYKLGLIGLLFAWGGYWSECRYPIRSRVESVCSKSYRRKTIKGINNRLFYTVVRERCQLDQNHVYIFNKLLFISLSTISLLHITIGWIPAFQLIGMIVLSGIFTIIAVMCLIIQPETGFRSYKERGQGNISSFISTALMELCILGYLILWYYCILRVYET